MEELQRVHVAVSGCVVDGVGSALRLEEEEEEKIQDLFLLTFPGITHRLRQVLAVLLPSAEVQANTSTVFWLTSSSSS